MGAEESVGTSQAVVADDLDRLVRRLRSLSPRSWQDRRGPAREALAGLVRLQSGVEGRQLEAPSLADHVLADAIAVVGGDLLDAATSQSESALLTEVHELLSSALAATR